MRDFFTKLRLLARILRDSLLHGWVEWYDEVWRKDLDSHYCCDGHECGCYGASVREMYLSETQEPKP